MVWIPGGRFLMGSADFYPEERPVHPVSVDGFWMDEHPVTVAEFRRFVKATGHVTVAEQAPDPADYPDADPELLVPGSGVFRMPPGPVSLDDVRNWWHWVPGADWRHPEGPGSSLDGRDRHPVTQVTWYDASAHLAWAGKALPTEAEWERAARGGLEGAVFAWGDEFAPKGRTMANTWHGQFPWQNLNGYPGTSPVKSFPPNEYGLYDMIGNVWEWTDDFYAPSHGGPVTADDDAPRPCCAPHNPRVSHPDHSYATGHPGEHLPRRVMKGGSHLCAPNYCLRYRPAARQAETMETSTTHIGFRGIVRPG
jgi:formylglycine-generating enzyme required for sulfatase activity